MLFEISRGSEGRREGVAGYERGGPRAMGQLRSLWGMMHDVESPVRGHAGRVAPGASSPDHYPVFRSYPHRTFGP